MFLGTYLFLLGCQISWHKIFQSNLMIFCISVVSVVMSSLYFLFFCLFRAAIMAYGGSQARGQIRVVAAGVHHSQSNVGSEPHMRPTQQLTARPDP